MLTLDSPDVTAAPAALPLAETPALPETATPAPMSVFQQLAANVNEGPPAKETPAAEPYIVNQADYANPRRMVQVLGDYGAFKDDNARGDVLLAKRMNHLLHGNYDRCGMDEERLKDFRKDQNNLKTALASTDYKTLVSNDTFVNALKKYMSFLIEKNRKKLDRLEDPDGKLKPGSDEMNPSLLRTMKQEIRQKLVALRGELTTYENGADYTKEALLRIEPMVKQPKYLPLGQLVVAGNFISDDQEFARDFMRDTLGVISARRLLFLSQQLGADENLSKLATSADNPQSQVRIQAYAEAVRQATQSLSAQFAFEQESPEVDRLRALETLVSAQIDKAFSQTRTVSQLAELEKATKAIVKEYAQVALSLAHDYLGTGPASENRGIQKIRTQLEAEAASCGITFLEPNAARQKAQALALASANDLMVAVEKDPALSSMVKTLALAAGVPEQTPLAKKSQIIAEELGDLSHNVHYVLSQMLQQAAQMATSSPTALLQPATLTKSEVPSLLQAV